MSEKRWDVLFIKDEKSIFDAESKMFSELFANVERAEDIHKALKLIYKNSYDIVIQDVSKNPVDGTTFIKQIKQMKPEQAIVALFSPEDEDKIGGVIEAGVNAFVLTPEQFDQALEAIAQFDLSQKK